MNNLLRIGLLTVKDLLRQKSFYALLALALFFVLLLRSCYRGTYIVNGRQMEAASLAFQASLIAFHVIAAGMFMMTTLLSMGIFARERRDGSMVMFLSRAVGRWQYMLGRISGIWLLTMLFMFTLHLTVSLIALAHTGALIPGYLQASLLCSINLLFAILLTCTLSLFLPGTMAALFTLIVIGVGFISDGAYQIMRSEALRQMFSNQGQVSTWRIFYPKIFMLQQYAASWLTEGPFTVMPAAYVWGNVLFYTSLLAAAVLWQFYRSEV